MTQLKRLRESELEKNVVKKYKVTSQISTRAFSKINNKIYCHHDDDDDDDSYTKNEMTIDHVNDDCLAEIFMYVPACERPKIALICKKWERVLENYSWFNVKKLELTHWEYDENPNYLIKHDSTIYRQYNFLKSLLNKFGRYLIELDLTAYSHCIIVPVINVSCPNLVKLRIRIKYMNDAIFDNTFTRLPKLKVLKIIFQCFPSPGTYIPLTLINSLLNVADTLIELNLSNWSGCMANNAEFPEEFTSVVSELKALKIIQIGGIDCPKSLVDHLLSRSPEVINRYDESKYQENKIDCAETFNNIKKLYNTKRRVTDDFLYNVANVMRNLHTIHVHCHEITDAGIVALSKMNHLKILDLHGYNNVTDSAIALLKNMYELRLPFSKKITNKSAIKVLENSPGMCQFNVVDTGVTYEFIKKADEISRNRKKKLKLLITDEVGKPNENIKYEYLTVSYIVRKKRQKKNKIIRKLLMITNY